MCLIGGVFGFLCHLTILYNSDTVKVRRGSRSQVLILDDVNKMLERTTPRNNGRRPSITSTQSLNEIYPSSLGISFTDTSSHGRRMINVKPEALSPRKLSGGRTLPPLNDPRLSSAGFPPSPSRQKSADVQQDTWPISSQLPVNSNPTPVSPYGRGRKVSGGPQLGISPAAILPPITPRPDAPAIVDDRKMYNLLPDPDPLQTNVVESLPQGASNRVNNTKEKTISTNHGGQLLAFFKNLPGISNSLSPRVKRQREHATGSRKVIPMSQMPTNNDSTRSVDAVAPPIRKRPMGFLKSIFRV